MSAIIDAATQAVIPESVVVPKPNQAVIASANTLIASADSYVIDSHEIYELAAIDLQQITALEKQLEEQRTSVVRPLNTVVSTINAWFKGPAERLALAKRLLKDKMNAFNAEQERIRKEEEARQLAIVREQHAAAEAEAARIAAEKNAEAERLKREAEEAEKKGDAGKAAELAVQANATLESGQEQAAAVLETAAMTTLAPVLATTAPRVSGISGRVTYEVESIDLLTLVKAAAEKPELYLAYVTSDDKKIKATVRNLKEQTNIPGVKVKQVRDIAARGTR